MLRENSNNQPSVFSPQNTLYSPEKKSNQMNNLSNHQSSQNNNEYSPFVIKQSNTYNFNKPLTERKILPKSATKLYTPSPNTSKCSKVSDRYIPLNKGINLMEKFNMINVNENESDNGISTAQFSSQKEQEYVYKQLLRNNFMKENFNTPIQTNTQNIFGMKNEFKTNIFSFNSSGIKKKNSNNFYSIINQHQQGEAQDEENTRKINSKPYKILNAPNIMDDFYLNLLDWSCQNEIAVGLGSSVVLWCTNQTKEMKLVDYNNQSNINANSINISNNENPQDKYVSSLIWSNSGNELAVGTSQGEVEIYDINTKKLVRILDGHEGRVGVVSWNGNLVSSGSKDCSINTWDLRAREKSVKFLGHQQEVCGLKWSFDGNQLASGGNDNHLMLWSLHSTKPMMVSSHHIAAVKALAWSPHQYNLLASGGGTADKTIRFWNTSTWSQLSAVDTGSQVCNLVFSKTAKEIVSTHGFSLNQIICWKLPSMTKIATLTGHSYRVLYLGLSHDGQSIVTGAGDQTLRFWNVFPPYRDLSSNTLFPSNDDIH